MDQITEQYSQKAQQDLLRIDQVGQAFRNQCDKLCLETEQKIAALDPKLPDLKDQENHLKLDLKRALDKMVTEFEKEMKNSFHQSLTNLEGIYHQKELMKLQQIENEILNYKS